MPKQKSTPMHPSAPAYDDYAHENLRQNEYDSDLPFDETVFHAMADAGEGVAGRKAIDTTYENYDEDEVYNPRSDHGFEGEATHRRPAPRDVKSMKYPHRHNITGI